MKRLGMVWMGLLVGCTQAHEASPGPEDQPLNTGETPTSVPVLELPAAYMTGAAFMTGERWYAINVEHEDLVVHLHATDAFVDRPADVDPSDIEHDAEVRGAPAFDTMDEGMRVISWMENGASYSLDVTCSREGDERCSESAFAIGLANELEPRR